MLRCLCLFDSMCIHRNEHITVDKYEHGYRSGLQVLVLNETAPGHSEVDTRRTRQLRGRNVTITGLKNSYIFIMHRSHMNQLAKAQSLHLYTVSCGCKLKTLRPSWSSGVFSQNAL